MLIIITVWVFFSAESSISNHCSIVIQTSQRNLSTSNKIYMSRILSCLIENKGRVGRRDLTLTTDMVSIRKCLKAEN